MVYCRRCGLWMTNGFCLHLNVSKTLKGKALVQGQ